jgi:transposase-like protein
MTKKQSGKSAEARPRSFTEEFKREAVRLALGGEKRRGDVARDLGVSYLTLSNWIRKFAKPLRMDGKVPQLSDQERIRELEREVREVKMERDILKKATAFFAKLSD